MSKPSKTKIAAEKIKASFRALTKHRALHLYDLNCLGYLVTDEETALVDDKGIKIMVLSEVVHQDTKQQAGFCVVRQLESPDLYVLPEPYRYFIGDTEPEFCGSYCHAHK